jgi:geranylgeranyl diphosphate synthase type 3
MTHFTTELLQLHRGQGMDLHWRDSLICPAEDEYIEMVRDKTGSLFRLGVKLMLTQSCEPISPDCVLLADMVGLIFQIRDDYRNLCSKECADRQGYCDDLTEGKFSFPIIHSIRHDPLNLELLNILRQKPTQFEVKCYAIRCMEGTGSLEYTCKFLLALIDRAKHMMDLINGDKEKNVLFQELLGKLAV